MSTPGGPDYGPYQEQPYGDAQAPYGGQPVYGEQPAPYAQQPPYGYGYYQQPGYGGYMPQPGTNGLAIAAMILGIVWIYWLGSLLAVIFGHIALSQTARTGQQGRGMAIAGVTLGWVGMAGLAILIVVLVADSNDSYYDYMSLFGALRAAL
ncbi:DUF4190 domain-containing protein [Embleya sp. NBC_00896]|uniref:DUF4190 domain-containing protein n=1 Tax=Embleya sp. NBC_00896 TaxID=2975961 RepID=UPI003870C5BD|nr:DUF4190 domain-containing protein [Embleya sp. NBC_00896]